MRKCLYFALLSPVLAASRDTKITGNFHSSQANTPPTTLATPTDPFVTIPLRVDTSDHYFNALVTDAYGNEVGARLDFLQPDIWLIDGLKVPSCANVTIDVGASNTLTFYVENNTTMLVSACHLGGAFTPMTVQTVTSGLLVATETLTITASEATTYSIPYPNGVVAEGSIYSSNLSLGTTGDGILKLDNFSFVLVDSTNKFDGGLGLALEPEGLGLLSYLKAAGMIFDHSYSVYLSDYDQSTLTNGALLLGAVDSLFVNGSFYAYPPIPYEGWDSSNFGPLPIILVNDIELENLRTGALLSLLNNGPVSFVLDSRLSFSFLPMETIVNLAIQADAYFSSDNNRWVVRCSDIESSDAIIHFKIGPLTVDLPLSDLMIDAFYGDSYLYFSSGVRACFLNVLPDTVLGYPALGLPFLAKVYFAMNNENGHLALGKALPNVYIDDYEEESSYSLEQLLTVNLHTANLTTSALVSFMLNGTIPFATTINTTYTETLIFGLANTSEDRGIPSLFSGITIVSGRVYITGGGTASVTGVTTSTASSLSNEGSPQRIESGSTYMCMFAMLWGCLGLVLA